jgi:hypothetical protein
VIDGPSRRPLEPNTTTQHLLRALSWGCALLSCTFFTPLALLLAIRAPATSTTVVSLIGVSALTAALMLRTAAALTRPSQLNLEPYER